MTGRRIVRRRRARPARRILPAAAAAFLAAGCGGMEMDSLRLDREAAVDGRNEEWSGAIVYVEDGGFLAGAMNDDENLYLCMIIDDAELAREAMARGFTLWIDPAGGKKERIGIHYPPGGGAGAESGPPERGVSDRPGGSDGGEPPAMDSTRSGAGREANRFGGDATWDQLRKRWPEIEVTGPGDGETHRLAAGKGADLEVALAVEKGTLVYEARIPLALSADHPFGIGTAPGETIGVGLEMKEKEERSGGRPERGERGSGGRGGGPPGGGMGGRGGGRPGGGTGGRGGGPPGGGMGGGPPGGSSSSEGFDLWAKVRLATATTTE